ncbi:toprim domain-containing protein, partial [Candidatus Woesearchaeota archaeon]|nr:toprim domain-containing protein [Candidatus Woesearchaeota archaeon]
CCGSHGDYSGIGPCSAKVKVLKIEDVRVSKRNFVIARAKELLRQLQEEVLPDSQEITEEVAQSVRMMGITEYGKDRLPAGPGIDESDEVIVVEGRADVLNLLKNGFKSVIALNGTSVPDTVKELSRKKEITLFVDGDRGGNLIIREVMDVCEVDYVIKAPDGKEVEEITKKEIHKALRNKVAAEQAKLELKELPKRSEMFHSSQQRPPLQKEMPTMRGDVRKFPPKTVATASSTPVRTAPATKELLPKETKDTFQKLLEDLLGTRGAYVLDEKLNILGKVPVTELVATMKSLQSGIFAVILDGVISKEIVAMAEKTGTQHVIAMDSAVKAAETKVHVFTSKSFE